MEVGLGKSWLAAKMDVELCAELRTRSVGLGALCLCAISVLMSPGWTSRGSQPNEIATAGHHFVFSTPCY